MKILVDDWKLRFGVILIAYGLGCAHWRARDDETALAVSAACLATGLALYIWSRVRPVKSDPEENETET